ncbi:MAG: glutamate synthase large subunit [Chloroflexi bacterium]|nr:MAG: glutamate synthase large subunit [Chloroflexota bacterium]
MLFPPVYDRDRRRRSRHGGEGGGFAGRRRRRRLATPLRTVGVELTRTTCCVEHPSQTQGFVGNCLWRALAASGTVAGTLRRAGLYDPRFEHDACGIGFVADAGGRATREIVDAALAALNRLRHRGAVAADLRSGDGAGMLLPLPQPFVLEQARRFGLLAGRSARAGLAMVFLSNDRADDGDRQRDLTRQLVEHACRAERLDLIGWRRVPVEPDALGDAARQSAPRIEQALIAVDPSVSDSDAEARCYRVRKRAEHAIKSARLRGYLASISFRTVTYKAMCAADQLAPFYPDLRDPAFVAPFAIFHQRYSTNTSPSWERAQPFRLLCHNGEINTIQGNVNRMRAREGQLGGDHLAPESVLAPVIDDDGSDSAMLDNALELLVRAGRDIRHALAMLVPSAWEGFDVDQGVRDFYRYHASLMEPWDGPAGLIFTDGVRVGAALDRNGLRPLRYAVGQDGLIACASEAGAVDLSGHGLVRRGKLGPGEMLCVDPERGGLQEDDTIKSWLAAQRPYGGWLEEQLRSVGTGEPTDEVPSDLTGRQVAFGYTKEEFTFVLRPMATQGHEPIFSMGDDTAPSVLAGSPRLLYSYFKQRFAQVTNPPIDHLRERLVMSLRTTLGPSPLLLSDGPPPARQLQLDSFLLYPSGLASLRKLGAPWVTKELDATFPVAEGPAGLRRACRRLGHEAERAVRAGAVILVVSDGGIAGDRAPVPALLAVGSVHQHLMRAGLRSRASLVAETDEAREVHHLVGLLGFGAQAVCPRLALQSITATAAAGHIKGEGVNAGAAQARFMQALEDGTLKVLAKMGISTIDSYQGAQIFEIMGLDDEVVETCFTGTPSPVGGATFADLGEEVLARHAIGFAAPAPALSSPGYFKHHKQGTEYHATNPDVVDALHDATAVRELAAAHALRRAVAGGPDGSGSASYERFARLVNDRPPTHPRDLLAISPSGPPVPLAEVEPAETIVRRFSSGAMSHGSIAAEAHETIAIAMNRLGGKSNTGEGGEDPARFRTRGSSIDRNSRIKQVASGRFGVTPEYCVFADELQIKMAQGSKPGEGGQLPGHKATEEIARLRHTQAGIALISPPPHHDIYSIEDLAQLIYDLKQVNPLAAVSVKLVAEAGVGTIAAGVVKGLADIVHIAGADGGTGASPLSSIKNAGMPWEIGLAETQQTLLLNDLRGRVRLRVDGGIKSGRDVVIAALLGADEYSFGTAALLAEGCIMVRTCHLDTCPAGIATQRPELRAKFAGTPEMLEAYLLHVAQEIRFILAGLGLRSLDQAIGRTELLAQRRSGDRRADRIDLSPLLHDDGPEPRRFQQVLPIQRPTSHLGDRLCHDALGAVRSGERARLSYPIENGDRSVGARLGGMLAREFGSDTPPGSATVAFTGAAGQSFGAFLTDGVEFELIGEANDYVGKGMGGGRIIVRPPADDAGDPHLLGNTVLYGATGGELFCAGKAGERFAVRNSGASAVVEGVGEHAAEYMTGGTLVILGPVGHNLGAGMTGGEVFVYDGGIRVPAMVNGELVDAHRLSGEHQLLAEQGLRLRALVERHAAYTRSALARAILDDWHQALHRFWRVAPKADVARIESQHEGTMAARA